MKQKVYRLSDTEKHMIMRRLAGVMEQNDDILFSYVYGSFVEELPLHDIDVGIYVANVEPASYVQHAIELAGALEREVHIPVDVRTLNFAPVLFLYHVVRGRLIFERDADLRAEIEEMTVRRYLDIKPFITRGIKEAFAA